MPCRGQCQQSLLGGALILAAGLEGIREGLDPVSQPGQPHRLSEPELVARGIGWLPRSLGEAIDAVEADPLVRIVFGDEMFESLVAEKRAEWDGYTAHVGVGDRTLPEVLVTMSHLWEELSSAQLTERLNADPDCVALIPVGATEQHGPHLPVAPTPSSRQRSPARGRRGGRRVASTCVRLQLFHGTRLAGTIAFSGEETAAAAGLVAEACVDRDSGGCSLSTATSATRPHCGSPATASGGSFQTCGSA